MSENKNKHIDLDEKTCADITDAVANILAGGYTKVIVNDNVKVYKCTNVIRIDLKITEDN